MVQIAIVSPKSNFSIPLSWRVSYIICLILVDLGSPFVDHAGRYLSA